MKLPQIKERQQALVIVFALFVLMLIVGAAAHSADIIIKPGDDAQQKINTYRANDTIRFDGTRVVSSVYSFPSNGALTVESTPGTILQATHHSYIFYFKGASRVTVWKNDLAGGNIYLQDCSWMTVTKNRIHDIANNGNNAQHGIFHLNLTDSTITDNDIFNIRGPGADTGVFGYGRKRSKINFNRILNVHEGIHDFYYDRVDQRGDNEVIGNLILGTERHSIEQQYCANGLKVQYNFCASRQPGNVNGMGDSNATGGVPGDPAGQNSSWDVDVSYNVFDFRGNTCSDYSQNAGVEAMRHIDVHHNWFVGNNTGKMQGILHSQNETDWKARDNNFQNVSNWISGGGGSPIIAPTAANQTGNKNFMGEPPTYAQLLAMANGAPTTQPTTQPIPESTFATNLVTTAGYNTIDLKWTINGAGPVLIERFTENGAKDVTFTIPPALPAGSTSYHDTQFAPSQYAGTSKWKFFYRVAGTRGDVVQIGIASNPPPPAPSAITIPSTPPIFVPRRADGEPDFTKATTRPSR